ncbi:MAG TPA: efflux RND transporter periplasmic adaptor subunit [Anaeromyxobacteraceae bacterium]
MKTKTKLWAFAVLALLVVVGVLAAIKVAQIRAMIQAGKSFRPPPESVTAAAVLELDWPSTRTAIGTLVAARAVTLGAELTGVIREIGFESGQAVKEGTLLVKLDTSTEEAQLAAAVADASLAKVTLARAKALSQGGANTPADLEAAQARAEQTEATVASLRATIAKKSIRAPFDGRLAIRQVERGQVVSSGTPVASLQSVTPIYGDFWLPQQALAELSVHQRVRMRTDIFPGASWDGAVSTVNPEVDVATRNVRVRATFQNADGRLRPGMFVNLDVLSGERRRALVVPATAVLYAPYGDSVYALEEKKDEAGKTTLQAKQTFVRLGERRGDFVEVTSGVAAGQRIVGSGAFKLRNGIAVAVSDAAPPPSDLAPRPATP